jgi:hypothetical protein
MFFDPCVCGEVSIAMIDNMFVMQNQMILLPCFV